jgi:hypothetical protein
MKKYKIVSEIDRPFMVIEKKLTVGSFGGFDGLDANKMH